MIERGMDSVEECRTWLYEAGNEARASGATYRCVQSST